MSDVGDLNDEEFQILREFLLAEQNFFWTRFVAFSALQTGQVVLLTVDKLTLVGILSGLATSIFWVAVQFLSLRYVSHKKQMFWSQSRVQRLRMDGSLLSSTRLGFAFSIFASLFWVLALLGNLLAWP